MRLSSLVLAAAAGITMGAFTTQAGAMNNTSAAGLRTALGPIDAVESVHCRPFRHGHRFGHWGRGCNVGEVEVGPRRGHVTIEERRRSGSHVDVNVRDRKVRGETSVRTREQTNVRSTNTNSTSERSSTRTGTGTGSNSRSSTTNQERGGETKQHQNQNGPAR
jgi:hypothetical protein